MTIRALSALLLFSLSLPAAAASLEASDPGERFARPAVSVSVARPSTDRAANRARLLDALQAYAVAADFPQNDDTPGGRQLYFLDSDGRACAVAHLMIQSGRLADVQSIAATNNSVKVTTRTRGAIAEWIRTSGFTVAEIMMIQEPDGYGYMGPGVVEPAAVVNADAARIQLRLLSVVKRLREANTRQTAGLSAS